MIKYLFNRIRCLFNRASDETNIDRAETRGLVLGLYNKLCDERLMSHEEAEDAIAVFPVVHYISDVYHGVSVELPGGDVVSYGRLIKEH